MSQIAPIVPVLPTQPTRKCCAVYNLRFELFHRRGRRFDPDQDLRTGGQCPFRADEMANLATSMSVVSNNADGQMPEMLNANQKEEDGDSGNGSLKSPYI